MKNQLLAPSVFEMKNDAGDTPRDPDEQQILVQSDQQLPEPGQHEPIARPKIPKNKLPSVFIPTKKKREDKPDKQQDPSQENQPKRASTDKPQRKQPNDPPRKPHSKKSMNPFIPARNQLRLFDKLGEEIMEAQQDYQRFAKLNIDKLATPAAPPLRLEQSLTLSQRVTPRGTVLKLILNVPTFRILYLEEIPITGKDTPGNVRSSLALWDSCPANAYQLCSHAMFWNMPEGNISILYDYVEMCPLSEVAQSCGWLPENAVREVVRECAAFLPLLLRAGVGVEGVEDMLQLARATGRVVLQPQVDLRAEGASPAVAVLASVVGRHYERDREKNIVFRIGYAMLRYSIGEFEFSEELQEVIASVVRDGRNTKNTSCCLLHTLDTISESAADASAFALYQSARRRLSPTYLDFLCHCLKYSSSQRLSLQSLRAHPFLTAESPGKVDLRDLIKITPENCQEIRDFAKIEQTVDLVLSNCVKVAVPQLDGKAVQVLAQQTNTDVAVVSKRISNLYSAYTK